MRERFLRSRVSRSSRRQSSRAFSSFCSHSSRDAFRARVDRATHLDRARDVFFVPRDRPGTRVVLVCARARHDARYRVGRLGKVVSFGKKTFYEKNILWRYKVSATVVISYSVDVLSSCMCFVFRLFNRHVAAAAGCRCRRFVTASLWVASSVVPFARTSCTRTRSRCASTPDLCSSWRYSSSTRRSDRHSCDRDDPSCNMRRTSARRWLRSFSSFPSAAPSSHTHRTKRSDQRSSYRDTPTDNTIYTRAAPRNSPPRTDTNTCVYSPSRRGRTWRTASRFSQSAALPSSTSSPLRNTSDTNLALWSAPPANASTVPTASSSRTPRTDRAPTP